jgi:hypothetical protein
VMMLGFENIRMTAKNEIDGKKKYGHNWQSHPPISTYFLYGIGVTCQSYLTKINKILNLGKTIFKVSCMGYLSRSSTKWANMCHKCTSVE